MHFSGTSCEKHAPFAVFQQNKGVFCATSLNKNCIFKAVSREKSMNFADFQRSNCIFTQPVTRNRAVQNISY